LHTANTGNDIGTTNYDAVVDTPVSNGAAIRPITTV
jgi:hypothetical protein